MTTGKNQRSFAERRKYVRLDTQVVIKHDRYSIPVPESWRNQESIAKNISAGGVLFVSNVAYTLGDIVRLEMHLPGWERHKPEFYKEGAYIPEQPLMALVKVVRVEMIRDGMFEIGAFLAGVDEGHQMALKNYLDLRAKQEKRSS